MVKLGVNIDHIATIRNLRKSYFPDPVYAAEVAEDAGADGITVHLREDRRHINEKDVKQLKEIIRTKLNLEMSIAPDIVAFAKKINPDSVCLVPEKRQELTTEGGLNIIRNKIKIKNVIEELKSSKKECTLVSVFINPDKKQIEAAKNIGADFVELHTGKYADAQNETERKKELRKIQDASEYVLKVGLGLNAGHGLDYSNVKDIARIEGMQELNIGYSIICRAVFIGFSSAIKEMKELLRVG
ncbi:MAG: pyridoxine 5'-phosphate synthase [Elusimicrobia bacterium RIFOXYD2_FULL_34_15]|nr:MAG: pyridoxine 5'-phosphate synthase [Elusimicrobia bacterium RIFOXYD2_FULL_34_15]